MAFSSLEDSDDFNEIVPPLVVCDICTYPGAIVQLSECGHKFHSRCVYCWPLPACPICCVEVQSVELIQCIPSLNKMSQRCGKWSNFEEAFVFRIIEEFSKGSLPLADCTPVRILLADLLHCSPMRLSKKFQKNAIGKKCYKIVASHPEGNGVLFPRDTHEKNQKKLSHIESLFYDHIRGSPQQQSISSRDLRHSSCYIWQKHFIKFASIVGQRIVGIESPLRKITYRRHRTCLLDQCWSWCNANEYSHPPGMCDFVWDPDRLWKPFDGKIDYRWLRDLEKWDSNTETNDGKSKRVIKRGLSDAITKLLRVDVEESLPCSKLGGSRRHSEDVEPIHIESLFDVDTIYDVDALFDSFMVGLNHGNLTSLL